MTGSKGGLPGALLTRLESVVSSHLARSVEILEAAPVSGGCIHETARLKTSATEDFFVKWAENPLVESHVAESHMAVGHMAEGHMAERPLSDVFAAEADGLSALREATALTVPEVIAHADTGENPAWLLLEYVPPGSPGPDYGERLGTSLAELHEAREGPYGWHRSNYIGSLPQANTPTTGWAAFWWAERLEAQMALARDAGRLTGLQSEWAELESKLPTLLADAEEDGCSLLHGDLWSGNVYAGPDGSPVLVDPAAYRGHREVDLAMTELFGGFPRTFYEAYESRQPVTDGYREVRRGVYQLYPLLVHVNLFGGTYVEGATRALRNALASA